MVRSARRSRRAPVTRVRLDPVPAWEELPEASRAAAGCLMAVLMMRMIRAGHAGVDRDRLAVVYVRQSTMAQVIEHGESTRLQYGLAGRAAGLGWESSRVLVIDEDLGHSASGAGARPGFQRLVSEVGLDHVGSVLGIEMAPLARAGRVRHELLELCARSGTLLGDLEGIYDPATHNDRLLLGLKGTISEAELHLIRQRMQGGRIAKARRGELAGPLPSGFVRRPSGEVILDPDEQVRAVIALVFSLYDRIGTVGGELSYLAGNRIQ